MLKRILFIFTLLSFAGLLAFLTWIQIFRYKTEQHIEIDIQNRQTKLLKTGQVLNLMLWNISYGGMPNDMDFFYSGGTLIRTPKEDYQNNFRKILQNLNAAKDSLDIILIHKLDTLSKRSYKDHQLRRVEKILPDFENTYALNFSVPFIPVPLDEPIGRVHSGMISLSRFHTQSSFRLPLNNKRYYWPKRLFTAQKCILLNSYQVGKKQLHIINVHLNSYDYLGEIRLSQLQQIWELADSLQQKGDYVILGGGWNMNPPGFKKYRIKNGYKGKPSWPEIDSSIYFKNWRFDYRMDLPTSRNNKEAYRHGAISSSIKDFFICSPNVAVLEVNTADQKFELSDHQAIYIKVFLIPD